MKVGDYVRFENGVIGKISDIDEPKRVGKLINIEDSYIYYKERDIKKSSPNIIDLIEVGDFINGEKVEYIEHYYDTEEVSLAHTKSYNYYDMPDRFSRNNGIITSIVTKEQFKEMEYKI